MISLLFFLKKDPKSKNTDEFNPGVFINSCVEEAVKDAIGKMLPQGGFMEPKNYKLYNNTKIEYICENKGYFNSCINQHPLFLDEIKREILEYVKPKLDACFSTMKKELEEKNYQVETDIGTLKANLENGKILLYLNKNMTIKKNEESRKFEEFEFEITTNIYDLANVAIDTAGQEAKYCYFEYVGYMLLHPEFNIRKTTLSESTKIYSIKSKKSQEEINIAIRGCAIPPGI